MIKHKMRYIYRLLLIFLLLVFFASIASAEKNPIELMRDEMISFFKPLKGRIISIENGLVTADIGSEAQVKPGMRFTVYREGSSFLHPVTKQPIGLMETIVGKAEVKEVSPDRTVLTVISGEIKESDKIRISEKEVKILFYQTKNVDWSIADSYYRLLRDTGRFELLDTTISDAADSEVIDEAKRLNADVVLILSTQKTGDETILNQNLFWVDNPSLFFQSQARITGVLIKELSLGEEFFGVKEREAQVYVDLPFGVKMIVFGDVDGDGSAELIISTGKDIRLYMSGGELSSRYEIKGSVTEDHVWLDAFDINKDGKDEIIVSLIKDKMLLSKIYELKDEKFSPVFEGNIFLRRIGNDLIAQAYDYAEGYKGSVYLVSWDNGYKKGDDIKLPNGVNIYDFIYLSKSDDKQLILAYDNEGYMNLYDGNVRIWRSKEDYGGFTKTFKKQSLTIYVDRGEWSIKDRLIKHGDAVLVLKRNPLVAVAKGLGYNKSEIRSISWTGVSVEEKVVARDVSGNALDFALAGNRLVVLSNPLLGLKFKNILKGESPLGSALYIYSFKNK